MNMFQSVRRGSLLLTTTLLFCSGLLQADPTIKAPMAIPSYWPETVTLDKSFNCFRGPMQNYQSFIEFLMAKPVRSNQAKEQRDAWVKSTFKAEDFQRYQQQLDCQEILYSVDGVQVRGFVIKPKHHSGKLPVLIYNRGGNGSFGALVFGLAFHELMLVAEQGFMLLASNYRSDVKQKDRQLFRDEFGGAEIADVLALVSLSKDWPDADFDKLAVWGHSRGSMMAYLVAAQLQSKVKAVVASAGVADLEQELKFRPEMEQVYQRRIPGYANHKTDVLQQRSVLYFLDQLPKVPVLLQHGDADVRVSVEQSKLLDQALTKRQWPHQLMVYQGADHGFDPVRPQARADMVSWLRQQLQISQTN